MTSGPLRLNFWLRPVCHSAPLNFENAQRMPLLHRNWLKHAAFGNALTPTHLSQNEKPHNFAKKFIRKMLHSENTQFPNGFAYSVETEFHPWSTDANKSSAKRGQISISAKFTCTQSWAVHHHINFIGSGPRVNVMHGFEQNGLPNAQRHRKSSVSLNISQQVRQKISSFNRTGNVTIPSIEAFIESNGRKLYIWMS